MPEETNISISECYNFIYSALNKANTKGAFSLEEAKSIAFVCDKLKSFIVDNKSDDNITVE